MATVSASARATRRRGRAGRERLLAPVRLAGRRLRVHAGRTLLVALGIAVGAAVLATTVAGSLAVRDRAVQRALAQLQPSDRAVQAVWSGVPGQSNLSQAALDRIARRALRPVLRREPFGVVAFRQATWGGAFVNLGAVDGLARWLTLRGGRLPRPCTPQDCELVQIGGAPVAPRLPFLHVVGRATFRRGAPLAQYFEAAGGHRPPILLADGVLRFSRTPLPDAATIARTYGWIVPLAPGSIHEWELASLGDRLDRAQSQLERVSDIFTVAGPTQAIADVQATSGVAGERLLILGGDAAVLLLGFAVLAAARLRRDHGDVRRRLTWFGGTRAQILLVAAVEAVALTLVASALGWTAGAGAGALLAHHLGAPGALVVAHSIFTWRTLGIAAALAALTALVLVAALRTETIGFGGVRLSVADVAALGALGAVLLALARGKADAGALAASGGTGVVLLLLPGLVLFVLAVAAARLLVPLLRLLERSARRAPASLRVALLSLARSPGQVLLSVVFFVLSVGVALFAIAYRATLLHGEVEQARYAVPAPFVLQEDLGRLVTVQAAATPGQYASLGRVAPVLRDSGYVSARGGVDFTLLALPAHALARIDGWRSSFSSRTPAQLAQLLRPPSPPVLRGLTLSAHAARVTLPLRVRGDRLGITLVVLDRRGDFTPVPLGELGPGTHAPSAALPSEARGGRIVAIRLSFPLVAAFVAGHRESGTSLSVSDSSRGSLRLDRRFAGWIGTNGVRADGTTFRYLLNRAADSVIRPRGPLDGVPVPVVATPDVARAAGPGGIVPLHVEDQVLTAQVVATASDIPSVDGAAVVADLPTWLEAANAAEPGTTTPSELWLDAPPATAARLAQPPFSALSVESQRATEASLRGDPLARGSIALLLATALVALGLAAVGILLAVVGDLRDESGALLDLSGQGATPAQLRRHVLLRAALVAGVGLALGVAAGAVVCALVVAVVTVTAGAANAVPPLALVLDWPFALAALGCVALAAAAASSIAVRRLR